MQAWQGTRHNYHMIDRPEPSPTVPLTPAYLCTHHIHLTSTINLSRKSQSREDAHRSDPQSLTELLEPDQSWHAVKPYSIPTNGRISVGRKTQVGTCLHTGRMPLSELCHGDQYLDPGLWLSPSAKEGSGCCCALLHAVHSVS